MICSIYSSGLQHAFVPVVCIACFGTRFGSTSLVRHPTLDSLRAAVRSLSWRIRSSQSLQSQDNTEETGAQYRLRINCLVLQPGSNFHVPSPAKNRTTRAIGPAAMLKCKVVVGHLSGRLLLYLKTK